MARENKRTRDERRFGKAERLADMILAEGIAPPPWIGDNEAIDRKWRSAGSAFLDGLGCSPIVEASNVAVYAMTHPEAIARWDLIPAFRAPFPCYWVEFSGTSINSKVLNHVGALVLVIDKDDAIGAISIQNFEHEIEDPDHRDYVSKYNVSMVDSCSSFAMVAMAMKIGGLACQFPMFNAFLFLGSSGEFVVPPLKSFPMSDVRYAKADGLEMMNNHVFQNNCLGFLNTILLTTAFMNCKNVSLTAVDPPREFNRERRKAGLRPFVRYHTINIEPMKAVLRTEGNVEANGLRKALHIVRGHFAHYSEDKPLFGRVAGTFWRPSHVRGSLDHGVVISDYNVNAPAEAKH